MRRSFIIQLSLTTLLFFLFLNLFGSSFVSSSTRSNAEGLDHEWAATPDGVIAVRGTFTITVRTEENTYEVLVIPCGEDYLYDCRVGMCVPEDEACDCYRRIH